MWRGAIFYVSLEQIVEAMSSPLFALNFAIGFQLKSKAKSMKIRNKTESKASRGPMISTQISKSNVLSETEGNFTLSDSLHA